MKHDNVAKGLQELVNSTKLPSYLFPVKNGDRINIGSYSVAQTKDGYSVKSYKTNCIIAETYTKEAAIAIAKTKAKNKGVSIQQILSIDSHLAKHMIDCMFYKNSLKRTTDDFRYEILCTRYDISKEIVDEDKEKLKQFIF